MKTKIVLKTLLKISFEGINFRMQYFFLSLTLFQKSTRVFKLTVLQVPTRHKLIMAISMYVDVKGSRARHT